MGLTQLSGQIGQFLPPQFKDYLRKRIDVRYERAIRVVSHISAEDRVLDVGCVQHTLAGKDWEDPPFGTFLHADLVRHADHVTGIDIVEEDVRQMAQAGFDVRVGDAQDFGLDETFDVIVAGELIEHLENPGDFLECCRDHLSKDGAVILTTPNPHNLKFALWSLLGKTVNEEHTAWFDHDVIGTLARRAGLVLDEYEYLAPTITLVSLPLYKAGIAKPVSAGSYIFVLTHP